jgi:Ni/Fe-hydrogenase 1 B-type cytochrome subunit
MTIAAGERARQFPATPRPAPAAVYVWELPVRLVHWTIVLALLVLSVTGYYIHHPFLSGEANAAGVMTSDGNLPGQPGFTMGLVRSIHEIAGFVLIAAVLVRLYWAFAGNRYAHWRALLPVTSAQRRELVEMVRYYALRRRHPPRAIGHNPLASLAYIGLYAFFLLVIVSGLGLFAWVSRIPAWMTLFGWTYSAIDIQHLRLLHFLLMFVFAAFTVHHVYSAILIDVEERNGEISSIFSGYKTDFADGDAPHHDDPRLDDE